MLGMCCATDVYGSENDEDVRLQEGDQNLECREEDEHEERQNSHGDESRVALGLEERLRQHGEGHEKDVTGEHVGEQSHRKGERADEEGRDEFDRGDQDVQRLGYPGWKQRTLEVAETLVLEAGSDEHHPDEQG